MKVNTDDGHGIGTVVWWMTSETGRATTHNTILQHKADTTMTSNTITIQHPV